MHIFSKNPPLGKYIKIYVPVGKIPKLEAFFYILRVLDRRSSLHIHPSALKQKNQDNNAGGFLLERVLRSASPPVFWKPLSF